MTTKRSAGTSRGKTPAPRSSDRVVTGAIATDAMKRLREEAGGVPVTAPTCALNRDHTKKCSGACRSG